MEVVTILCPKCKGTLRVDKDTKQCFCMYCRAEVIVKKDSSSGDSVTLDSLMKKGFLSLEYSEWSKAEEAFDQAANIDPEHGVIYVGKLLAELEMTTKEKLANHDRKLSVYANYEKAIRFASSDLKEQLEGYNDAIKKRLANAKAEEERKLIEAEEKRKLAEEDLEKQRQLVEEERERQRQLTRERRAKNAPKRRRVAIIIALVAVLVFAGGMTGYMVLDQAEARRVIAEQERIEEERLAEEQRLLDEAEAERQVIKNLIDERIEAGYESWQELVQWALGHDIPWSIRVSEVQPDQELMALMETYGIHGNYIEATALVRSTEDSDEVILALHFESATYREAPAELSQLNNNSEDDLNEWLENGGAERAEEWFNEVSIIIVDHQGDEIIEEPEFGKEFISWEFEIDQFSNFENTFLHIGRVYQILEPTIEHLQQSILELILERIEQIDYRDYPVAFSGQRLAQGRDLSALSEWLDIEEIIVDKEGVLSLILRNVDARENRISDGDRRLSRPLDEESFIRWDFEYELGESENFDNYILRMVITRYYDVIVTGITQENFDAIQDGMSLEEVDALLGREGTVSSAAGNVETRSWQSDTRIIIVTFQDGEVVGKSQTGL